MKKGALILGLGFAFVTLGSLFGAALSKNAVGVDAYSTASLPTTIYLNDTSESNVRSYYSSLNGQNLSGNDLLIALKSILKDGQKYYAYDNDIWKMYEITDRDWELSPAEETTYGTYNSATNTLTGYTYGTSNSNPKNDPYVHALYINRNVVNLTKAWGNHNQDQWGINREHVWAKSHGFGADVSETGGARGDPMHLMAGNGYANNIHSNYFYGFVDKNSSHTDCGNKYSNQSNNLLGKSTTFGGGTVFEPQDCDKGDIARAIFYMAARYNYLSESDPDGININNPNLKLTQATSDFNGTGSYVSSTTTAGEMGIISDLLVWNKIDPVDDYEVHRNNLLYTNYTNNRNPFIDFPEWADAIWGTATYDSTNHRSTSYSSTPVGYADPQHDSVSLIGGASSKELVSIAVSGEKTSFAYGESFSFGGTVTGTFDDDSEEDVTANCSFSGYNMTSSGNQTVTVTHTPSGLTTTYSINVANPVIQSIFASGAKTSFFVGDTFTFGGSVLGTYSDYSNRNVTNDCTFSGYNMSVAGDQTVTVTHTPSGLTTTYDINVVEPELVSIAVSGAKLTFMVNESFVFGGTVTGTYENSSVANVTAQCTFSGYDLFVAGEQTVTVTHTPSGLTTTYNITVDSGILTETYVKVTSVDELFDQDKIILIGLDQANAFSMWSAQNNYREVTEVDIVDGKVTITSSDEVYPITISSVGTNIYTLFDGSKYLAAASSTKNNMNSIASLKDREDDAAFTISFENDGRANLIAESSAYTNNQIRYNIGSPRFSCYGSNSSMSKVYIYKCYEVEADRYGSRFLTAYTSGCNPSGGYSTLQWAEAKTDYNALTLTARNLLTNASVEGTSTRNLAVARYEYILKKYGTATFDDFMHRDVEQGHYYGNRPSEEGNNAPIIFIAIVASLSLLVGVGISAKKLRK